MTIESLPIWVEEEKLTIRFKTEAKENKAASVSKVEFDEVLYVTIYPPGSNNPMPYEVIKTRPDGSVKTNEKIYNRFKKYVDEYIKNKGAVAASGTPIEEWALVNASRAALLKSVGIVSVEQLAEVPESQFHNIGMGALELRQKARDWLESAKNNKASMEAKAENKKLQDQINKLQSDMDALADAVNEELDEAQKTKVRAALKKKMSKTAA